MSGSGTWEQGVALAQASATGDAEMIRRLRAQLVGTPKCGRTSAAAFSEPGGIGRCAVAVRAAPSWARMNARDEETPVRKTIRGLWTTCRRGASALRRIPCTTRGGSTNASMRTRVSSV